MASGGGATWSKEETLKLIEVWGQETIQEQLSPESRHAPSCSFYSSFGVLAWPCE